MLSSIILLLSVAFCAQLHFCAAAEPAKILELPPGVYYVMRVNLDRGRKCTLLTITKGKDNSQMAKLTFMNQTADGQLADAEPMTAEVKLDAATGYYTDSNGQQIFKVISTADSNGIKEAYLECKLPMLAPMVCVATNHDDVDTIFMNDACPKGKKGEPYYAVSQDHDICKGHDHGTK